MKRTKYLWLHYQGVGPLYNNIRGAPITMDNVQGECNRTRKNPQPHSNSPRMVPQLCQSTTPGHNAQQLLPVDQQLQIAITFSQVIRIGCLRCLGYIRFLGRAKNKNVENISINKEYWRNYFTIYKILTTSTIVSVF